MIQDPEAILLVGMGIIVGVLIMMVVGIHPYESAKFVCETHGLELIEYETIPLTPTFSKVECGKPKQQYEEYKVFKASELG